MRELRGFGNQMPNHRIVPNVFGHSYISVGTRHAHFGKSSLPDRKSESEFASCPKCESAFYELHRFPDADVLIDCEQQVEMVGHDDEFVETKFLLRTIVIENADEEASGSTARRQISFSIS